MLKRDVKLQPISQLLLLQDWPGLPRVNFWYLWSRVLQRQSRIKLLQVCRKLDVGSIKEEFTAISLIKALLLDPTWNLHGVPHWAGNKVEGESR